MYLAKLTNTIFILFLFSFQSFGMDTSPSSQFYKDLIKKHQEHGHLNSDEAKKQQFEVTKSKKWQKNFNKQVRGVASSMQPVKETITLTNPAIEISVK